MKTPKDFMTTDPKQAAEQTYTDILLGRLRVKAGAKKPTPTQEYIRTLVDRSRRDHAKRTEEQARAALLRGCVG